MLSELRISGLGVIDEVTLPLHPGLNVVTGETGAGKTMVVSGLLLLFGARGDSGLVRSGAGQAVIEGLVAVDEAHPAARRVQEAGGRVEDGIVLARTVSGEGRSRAYVGGRAAPVGVLADVGESLLAVHGQADQWRLREPDQHRAVLDRFGGADLHERLTAYRLVWDRLVEVRRTLDRMRAQARDRVVELEGLQAGLEHIERVAPLPGEDAALRQEDERLSHAEELRGSSAQARTALAGDEDGTDATSVLSLLARARAELETVARTDPAAEDLHLRAVELVHLAVELSADVSRYAADVDLDPARLMAVQERRAELATLTRRYGPSLDDVFAWAEEAATRHAELSGADDRIGELERELEDLSGRHVTVAKEVSEIRSRAAAELGERVTQELGRLAMGAATVTVEVTPADPGPHGADAVSIMLAANPGEPGRPITRAASGGELSRVMLALEVALGAGDSGPEVPVFVFDEVDAGVGGAAARDVGARLASLADNAQVIVVTHLAQVAAFADHHLVVAKSTDGEVTASDVSVVTGPAREDEIARLLAGTVSDTAREHARELLADARS
ncbi:DNA repair protein RecN [Nostocoides sp. F2B08]|uniref:DNA repair protein RecN n=1 Tax=Nostocoides sp. F2B08 TaxID=2653936 RepID=UPI001263723F|nr:DNA repair protein RecN [Tetrasphaera sp. F2B08]KAB7744627.1 DNA repair protein RecN [Tetrasphaera sp. F2B08]